MIIFANLSQLLLQLQQMYEKLSETLKSQGYSLTQPRMALFSALQSGKPRTMHELTLDLSSVMNRASIYRTVELFEKLGVVTRIQTGWKYKIELSDLFSPHHHHLTCTNCKKSINISEPEDLENSLRKLADDQGFTITNHHLELFGLCSDCKITRA